MDQKNTMAKSKQPHETRLFLDCSYIIGTDHMTGIQRVVRNILNDSKKIGQELETDVHYVAWSNGVFKEVSWPPRIQETTFVESLKNKAKNILKFTLPPAIYAVLGFVWARLRPKVREIIINKNQESVDSAELAFRKGDLLILLDSSWQIPYWREVEEAKVSGAKVGIVVYDLIPINLPQFCDSGLVAAFSSWLPKATRVANFGLTISEATRKDLKFYVKSRGISNHLKTASFKLGADLDNKIDQEARLKIKKLFNQAQPFYLSVGTIEPRKNQSFLLDTFESLWEDGNDSRLCIVGKIGWHTEALVKRIKRHSEYNKKLFLLNDLSDSELELAYKHAKALLIPSIQEGYGLPIIEALRHKIPVFASDIPVFREVGKRYCAYFDLNLKDSLKNLLKEFEVTRKFQARTINKSLAWPNWKESTREFLQKALKLSGY